MNLAVDTSTDDDTLVAAVSGKAIRVLGYVLISESAQNVTLKSNTTAITGAMPVGAVGGAVAPISEFGWMQTGIGEALKIGLSAPARVAGHLMYEVV